MKRAWLVSFNVLTLLAWIFFLIHGALHGLAFDGRLLIFLSVAQGLAIFEVVHSVIGWAGSHWMLTALQVASRFFTVALLWWLPESLVIGLGPYSGFQLITIAWGITEVIRAAYYTAGLMTWPTRSLSFLRYNLFIVLYPIGLIGELMVMFSVMEHRHYNFDVAGWAMVAVGLMYVIFFPKMYGHMLKQRSKKLGK